MKDLEIPTSWLLYIISYVFTIWGLYDTVKYKTGDKSSTYYQTQISVYSLLLVILLVLGYYIIVRKMFLPVLFSSFVISLGVIIYGIVDMYKFSNKDKEDTYSKTQQGIYITTLILLIISAIIVATNFE